MIRVRYRFVIFLAAILMGTLGCGCSGSSSSKALSISPSSVALGPSQTVQFKLSESRTNVIWSAGGVAGGNATVGTIDANGNYTAPSANTSTKVMITATVGKESMAAQVLVVAPGIVAPTANPQVALYTISPPDDANVTIQFGQTTNYGLATWAQPAPQGGGAVAIFVAGMLGNTTYHMQAMVKFSDGLTFTDMDHMFTTQALTAVQIPKLTVTTTPGMTPQSGVEFLNLISTGGQVSVGVTDLAGNMVWGYNAPHGVFSNGAKQMPNGHFLINFDTSGIADGAGSIIQEVDLGGNVVWQLTAAQLNQALATATCTGCNITVVGTHHDFAVLPNGHLILIAAQQKVESGLTGFPNPVTVTGDVLIDLDQNHNPVWLWSEFDHLDLNRHPIAFPDWTHTNAVTYSPDDKALIVSMRNQSWVIKIDYGNGQGTGNILWRLGFQGDFTLVNGTDPVDWFSAQHDANVISTNSSGVFQLLLFDNGDNRVLDTSGNICGTTTPCISRVPIMQLDESAKTATIEWVDDLSPVFSTFGGSARLLTNGNVEFDECAPTFSSAAILEVTKTTPPQTVWQMQINGQNNYRGFRMPSLYPGVQW
jgi:arylsulfate sulfotransferase